MTIPKISIITVVYNSAPLLPITISSVEAVKSESVEWVVIDGTSTDDSLEIIKSTGSLADVVISEPDKGIYDAMNKGLKAASGEYVIFINAGDEIRKPAVDKIFRENIETDIIYGDTMFVDNARNEMGLRSSFTSRPLPKVLSLAAFSMGQAISHQAFFMKRTLSQPYDLRYRISADYEWMVAGIKCSSSFCNLELPVANFLYGGVSKQQQKKALKERFRIMLTHYGVAWTVWSHAKIILRGVLFYAKNRRMD